MPRGAAAVPGSRHLTAGALALLHGPDRHTKPFSPASSAAPATASSKRAGCIPEIFRMVMAIDLLNHLDRHPDKTRRLPRVDAILQHPGDRGVPEHVRRHPGELGPRRGVPERVLDPRNRAAGSLDHVLGRGSRMRFDQRGM